MDIQSARTRIEEIEQDTGWNVTKVFVAIFENRYGRDINGNATSHYVAYLHYECKDLENNDRALCDKIICESGYYREQRGYNSNVHEAALVKINKLGFELDENNSITIYENNAARRRDYVITNW